MKLRTILLGLITCSLAGCATAQTPPAEPANDSTQKFVSVDGLDSVRAATLLLRECERTPVKLDCYQASLIPVASGGKVRLAMGTLDELGKLDAGVRTGGHVLAHAIGIAAGMKSRDITASFPQCSESFQSGCYHGVIQAYFSGLDSIGAKETNALCEPFRARQSDRWIRFQCVHGMGHGLTMLYAHDLPRGLAGCDLLSDDWDRHSCYSGAFMENIVNVQMPHHPASQLAHHGKGDHDSMDGMAGMEGMEGMDHSAPAFKPLDPADPLYPCSVLADRYLTACYEMQTSVMLYENHGDIAGAAKSCDTAPVLMRTTCYVSLGRDVSSYSAQNHTEAIRMCSLGQERYQPWCYYGLVKNIIDLNARSADGMAMCRDVPSSGSKAECYNAVGEEIWVLDPTTEGRTQLCSVAEPGYADACLYGARVKSPAPQILIDVWKRAEK
jgi:hypothetical protein